MSREQMTNELIDVAKRVTDRLQATEDRLMEYVKFEDALCPTGMTFVDHINDLQRQLADALAALAEKQNEYVPHP